MTREQNIIELLVINRNKELRQFLNATQQDILVKMMGNLPAYSPTWDNVGYDGEESLISQLTSIFGRSCQLPKIDGLKFVLEVMKKYINENEEDSDVDALRTAVEHYDPDFGKPEFTADQKKYLSKLFNENLSAFYAKHLEQELDIES